MAPNNVLPIYGNEKTMNLNPLVLANIQASPYFKVQLYELKTYHQVIDEIFYKVNHLEPWEKGSRKVAGQTGMCGGVRGVGTGGIVSSAFCLLYKLYTLKLTRKQVVSTCSHVDSPFIRGLGLLYIRYTQPPNTFWEMYEPYLDDPEEVDPKAGGGNEMTIGELCEQLLTKLEWYGTLFPRIPVPAMKEIEAKLNEHKNKRRKMKERANGDHSDGERNMSDRWGERERSLPETHKQRNVSRSGSRDQFGRKKRRKSERSPSVDRKSSHRSSRHRGSRRGSREKENSQSRDRSTNHRNRDRRDCSRSEERRRKRSRDREERNRNERRGTESSRRSRDKRDDSRRSKDRRGVSKRSRDRRENKSRDRSEAGKRSRNGREGSRRSRERRERSQSKDRKEHSRSRNRRERSRSDNTKELSRSRKDRSRSRHRIHSNESDGVVECDESTGRKEKSDLRKEREKSLSKEEQINWKKDDSKNGNDDFLKAAKNTSNFEEKFSKNSDHETHKHKKDKKRKKSHRHHHHKKSRKKNEKVVSGSDEGEIKD